MQLKDYRTVKCPFCGAEAYDFHAANGRYVGNPIFRCPTCKKYSFRKGVLEPSLLTAKNCFGFRFSSQYFKFRIGLILLYVLFLAIIIWRMDLYLSIYFVAMALLLYAAYEVIRFAHRRSYVSSREYRELIEKSLARMSDFEYAKLVLSLQQPQDGCPYLVEKSVEG